ncbi:hypothetical protein DFH06DRAFT_1319039 [Mycena polygramma]|nr:hypothetical protein DFH06DRAFT_1319039 [Mycena polygramma]
MLDVYVGFSMPPPRPLSILDFPLATSGRSPEVIPISKQAFHASASRNRQHCLLPACSRMLCDAWLTQSQSTYADKATVTR